MSNMLSYNFFKYIVLNLKKEGYVEVSLDFLANLLGKSKEEVLPLLEKLEKEEIVRIEQINNKILVILQ